MTETQNQLSLAAFAGSLATAMASLDYVVIVLGPSDGAAVMTSILAASPAFERCIGASTPATVRQLHLGDLFLRETRREAIEKLVDAINRKTSTAGEILLGTGHAPAFWLGYSLVQVAQPSHSGPCHVIIGKDITVQNRKAMDDRAIQRLSVNAFLAVDAASVVLTQTGRIVMATEQFSTFLGYGRGALDGVDVSQLLDAGSCSRISGSLLPNEPANTAKFSGEVRKRGGTAVQAAMSLVAIEGRGSERMAVLTMRDEALSADLANEEARRNGKIFLVSLVDAKAVLGNKWQAVAARAMLVAETVMRQRLSPEDIVSRTSEDSFLVWFAIGNAEENADKAARIARQVRIALLTKFADDITPSAPGVGVGAERGAGSARGDMEDAAAKVERRLAEPAVPTTPDEARAYLSQVAKAPPVAALPMFGRGGNPLPSLWLELQPGAGARLNHSLEILHGRSPGGAHASLLVLRGGITLCLEAARLNLARHYFAGVPAAVLANKQAREPLMTELQRLGASAGKKMTLMLCAPFKDMGVAEFRELKTSLAASVQSLGLMADQMLDLPIQAFGDGLSTVAFTAAPLSSPEQEAAFRSTCDTAHRQGATVIARRPEDSLHARKLLALGVDSLVGMEPNRG